MNRVRAMCTSLLLLTCLRPSFASECPGDLNGDGQVTVDEILTVVNASLVGCVEPATPTPTSPPHPSPTPTATGTKTRTPTPTPRFLNNGDGTISDTTSKLMWEIKSDDGSGHDKDLKYTWSTSGSTGANGTAFGFIAALNGSKFAGHRDWRLPTRDELLTIVDRNAMPGQPVVPAAFNDSCKGGCSITRCSCTTALNYWTATFNAANNQQAAYVLFNTGDSAFAFKTLEFYVRAVRSE